MPEMGDINRAVSEFAQHCLTSTGASTEECFKLYNRSELGKRFPFKDEKQFERGLYRATARGEVAGGKNNWFKPPRQTTSPRRTAIVPSVEDRGERLGNNIEKIDATPDLQELWRSISGHLTNIIESVNEIIDNSISNYDMTTPTHKDIHITIKEIKRDPRDQISVSIEDYGTGILNIQSAMKMGNIDNRNSPLNEWGLGLKHALAFVCPEGYGWEINTRTAEDDDLGRYKKISGPYNNIKSEIITKHSWPGAGKTGTIVKFVTDREHLNVIGRRSTPGPGRRGRPAKDFDSIVDMIVEDLGFTYSYRLRNVRLTVKSENKNDGRRDMPVTPVSPTWRKTYGEGKDHIPLDGKDVIIEYHFGEIIDSDTYKYHYIGTPSTSGVEIRLNGRCIASHLWKSIWNTQPHSTYNRFIGIVNIVGKDLPKTNSSKNGLNEVDPKLIDVYDFIRKIIPNPDLFYHMKETEDARTMELIAMKKAHDPTIVICTPDHQVFRRFSAKVRPDIFTIRNTSDGQKTEVAENKARPSAPLDAYQLEMQWDGAVGDGDDPSEGILTADSHPEAVLEIVKLINQKKDIHGNNYNFVCKTWGEQHIPI